MILSNTEIHKAIDEKRLVITPEPLPRTPMVGQACPYDTHTVDLKLHHEILVPSGGKFCIDLSNPGSITDVIRQHSRMLTLSKECPFLLEPYSFILARTLETISLPIQKGGTTLAARIEGKSSRARFGLIVHCTAPTIHPDFSGTLALEVVNLGPATFILKPEMYIAQLIIEEVRGTVITNPSGFQGQVTPAG
jgi:dCTP deaminase